MAINIILYGFGSYETYAIIDEIRRNPAFNIIKSFGVLGETDYDVRKFYQFTVDFNTSIYLPSSYISHMNKMLGHFLISDARRSETLVGNVDIFQGFTSIYESLHNFK